MSRDSVSAQRYNDRIVRPQVKQTAFNLRGAHNWLPLKWKEWVSEWSLAPSVESTHFSFQVIPQSLMTVPVNAAAVLKRGPWSKAKGQFLYSLSLSDCKRSSAYLICCNNQVNSIGLQHVPCVPGAEPKVYDHHKRKNKHGDCGGVIDNVPLAYKTKTRH